MKVNFPAETEKRDDEMYVKIFPQKLLGLEKGREEKKLWTFHFLLIWHRLNFAVVFGLCRYKTSLVGSLLSARVLKYLRRSMLLLFLLHFQAELLFSYLRLRIAEFVFFKVYTIFFSQMIHLTLQNLMIHTYTTYAFTTIPCYECFCLPEGKWKALN